MILKNYYLALGSWHTYTAQTGINVAGTSKTISGATSYQAIRMDQYMKSVQTSYAAGVILGDGDLPVTLDDYKLSGSVITGITASVAFSPSLEETGATASGLLTITNGNADSVTIKEIGICASISNTILMVERTVLDSPVTIPAGGVGQITYTIRMNYPTA